jgi:hypothetical protein
MTQKRGRKYFKLANSQLHHNLKEISYPHSEIYVIAMKGLNVQTCEQTFNVKMRVST